MHRLAIYQLKGGVGKTTTAVNLAALAARDGWPTLLWDLDPQGAASHILGAQAADLKIKKLLNGEQPAGRLVEATRWRHLDVLPSTRKLRNADTHLGSDKADARWLKQLLDRFSESYQLVIIDSPPALGGLATSIMRAVDMLLLPVEAGALARRAVVQVEEHLRELAIRKPVMRTFLNRVDRRRRLHREMAAAPGDYLPSASPVSIPASAAIESMGSECAPLCELARGSHPAARAFAALWQDTRAQLEGNATKRRS